MICQTKILLQQLPKLLSQLSHPYQTSAKLDQPIHWPVISLLIWKESDHQNHCRSAIPKTSIFMDILQLQLERERSMFISLEPWRMMELIQQL